jgi:hypothetical protein
MIENLRLIVDSTLNHWQNVRLLQATSAEHPRKLGTLKTLLDTDLDESPPLIDHINRLNSYHSCLKSRPMFREEVHFWKSYVLELSMCI